MGSAVAVRARAAGPDTDAPGPARRTWNCGSKSRCSLAGSLKRVMRLPAAPSLRTSTLAAPSRPAASMTAATAADAAARERGGRSNGDGV